MFYLYIKMLIVDSYIMLIYQRVSIVMLITKRVIVQKKDKACDATLRDWALGDMNINNHSFNRTVNLTEVGEPTGKRRHTSPTEH